MFGLLSVCCNEIFHILRMIRNTVFPDKAAAVLCDENVVLKTDSAEFLVFV